MKFKKNIVLFLFLFMFLFKAYKHKCGKLMKALETANCNIETHFRRQFLMHEGYQHVRKSYMESTQQICQSLIPEGILTNKDIC